MRFPRFCLAAVATALVLAGCMAEEAEDSPSARFADIRLEDSIAFGGETFALAGEVSSEVPIDTLRGFVAKSPESDSGLPGFAFESRFHGPSVHPQDARSWLLGQNGFARVAIDSNAAPGEYFLIMLAESRRELGRKAVAFPVAGRAWPPHRHSVAIGAQGSPAYPSSVDLDAPRGYLFAEAAANQGKLDAVFLFIDGKFRLMSPAAAKAAEVPFAETWNADQLFDTRFLRLPVRKTSQEEDILAHADGNRPNFIQVDYGDRIVVKTGEGNMVRLRVQSFAGTGENGTTGLEISFARPDPDPP